MSKLCLRENICSATGTSGPRLEGPELLVRDRNFRSLAEEDAVLRENELSILPVQDRNFWWGPKLPVEPDRKYR
jgi:hypothetical protein